MSTADDVLRSLLDPNRQEQMMKGMMNDVMLERLQSSCIHHWHDDHMICKRSGKPDVPVKECCLCHSVKARDSL